MCGCKIGRSMAKKRKKGMNITLTDVAMGGAGALASILVNPAVNAGIKNLEADTQEMVKKVAVAGKVVAGGYVATNKKLPREARFFGLGFGSVGVVEAGFKFMPQSFKMLGTGDGTNVFDIIGNSSSDTVKFPIAPSAPLTEGQLEEEALLGAQAEYRGVPLL